MNEIKIGTKLHASWGYSMTLNDYCQIIEVSKTGKTVKCRMLSTKMNQGVFSGDGSGRAKAGDDLHGPIFRLKVNGLHFHGSYPFCGAEKYAINTKMSDCSSRMGYFTITNGEESYENHWD
jgi:hypothetical protein